MTQQAEMQQPSFDLVTELRRLSNHARWPVQSYVLFGWFFGAVLTKRALDIPFLVAGIAWLFLVVGLTILNSYYDKDEKEVGGMKNPMKVTKTLLYGALILLAIGLGIGALFIPAYGPTYFILAVIMVIAYFGYSYEGTRWKSNGYMAVGINAFVGTLTLWGMSALGFTDANGLTLAAPIMIAAGLAAATFKASVYSMMQVHQIEEDTERGDISMAVMHGREWTLRFSQIMMVLCGVFSFICLSLIEGISTTALTSILPYLGVAYFALVVVLFELWIRAEPGVRADADRMQKMIVVTGYLSTAAFAGIYIVLSFTGFITAV